MGQWFRNKFLIKKGAGHGIFFLPHLICFGLCVQVECLCAVANTLCCMRLMHIMF